MGVTLGDSILVSDFLSGVGRAFLVGGLILLMGDSELWVPLVEVEESSPCILDRWPGGTRSIGMLEVESLWVLAIFNP